MLHVTKCWDPAGYNILLREDQLEPHNYAWLITLLTYFHELFADADIMMLKCYKTSYTQKVFSPVEKE